MTVAVIGDIHGSLNNLSRLIPKIKQAKALFVTGDITGTVSYTLIIKSILETKTISREKYTDLVYGKYREKFVKFQIKSAAKFLKLVLKLDFPVFFTHGNSETEDVREFFTLQSKDNDNLYYLENSVVKHDEWIISGYGYCSPAAYRKALQTPGEKEDSEIIKDLQTLETRLLNINSISNFTKFALFHEPPFNTKADYLPFLKTHGGSNNILSHINRVKYDYVFAGHIHESQGYEIREESLIMNPGALVNAQWCALKLKEKTVQCNKLVSLFNLKNFIYNTRNHFQ
ncbi:MAG: metallophosphoesterase [Candidatus Heimdallarchaeota archaeon]|nr:metallophosphoesterase [Candidatus Heimdallarchaeota archaeon]